MLHYTHRREITAMTKTETIAEFTGAAKAALEKFYADNKVSKEPVARKIVALNLAIEPSSGESRFFAYGGDETEEMELRALERVYLLINGIEVE